jgi:hypothetical protein
VLNTSATGIAAAATAITTNTLPSDVLMDEAFLHSFNNRYDKREDDRECCAGTDEECFLGPLMTHFQEHDYVTSGEIGILRKVQR